MENFALLNSPYDEPTLQYFKNLLLVKRRDAEDQANIIEKIIADSNEADDADFSSFAHQMGDMGSEVEDKQINYRLLEQIQKYIGQIDDALSRIEKGTYGVCEATGKPISKERLEAVPHTRYSIEAKNRK